MYKFGDTFGWWHVYFAGREPNYVNQMYANNGTCSFGLNDKISNVRHELYESIRSSGQMRSVCNQKSQNKTQDRFIFRSNKRHIALNQVIHFEQIRTKSNISLGMH